MSSRAARIAPRQARALDDDHAVIGFFQKVSRGQSGNSASDDENVAFGVALQLRKFRKLDALPGALRVAHDGIPISWFAPLVNEVKTTDSQLPHEGDEIVFSSVVIC